MTDPDEQVRWKVRIVSLTECGDDVMEHQAIEIGEVVNLVETGPSFYTIREITIAPANLETVDASIR